MSIKKKFLKLTEYEKNLLIHDEILEQTDSRFFFFKDGDFISKAVYLRPRNFLKFFGLLPKNTFYFESVYEDEDGNKENLYTVEFEDCSIFVQTEDPILSVILALIEWKEISI